MLCCCTLPTVACGGDSRVVSTFEHPNRGEYNCVMYPNALSAMWVFEPGVDIGADPPRFSERDDRRYPADEALLMPALYVSLTERAFRDWIEECAQWQQRPGSVGSSVPKRATVSLEAPQVVSTFDWEGQGVFRCVLYSGAGSELWIYEPGEEIVDDPEPEFGSPNKPARDYFYLDLTPLHVSEAETAFRDWINECEHWLD